MIRRILTLVVLAILVVPAVALASGYGRPSVADAEAAAGRIAHRQCEASTGGVLESGPAFQCVSSGATCAQMIQHPQRTYCLATFVLSPTSVGPPGGEQECTRGINLTYSKFHKIRVTTPLYHWECGPRSVQA